eukprot:Gb_30394 [translate_table: standard]
MDLCMYRMLIQESALLGLEPGRVAPRNPFSSTPGGADTPARITGDGYKNGGEVSSTRRHPGMNVDPSDKDNHFGPGREDSLIDHEVVDDTSSRGAKPYESLKRRQEAKRTHLLRVELKAIMV